MFGCLSVGNFLVSHNRCHRRQESMSFTSMVETLLFYFLPMIYVVPSVCKFIQYSLAKYML